MKNKILRFSEVIFICFFLTTLFLAGCSTAPNIKEDPLEKAASFTEEEEFISKEVEDDKPKEELPEEEGSKNSTTPITYYIVDTGQINCFNNSEKITCPAQGQPFYGQDAQLVGAQPSYTDNGDETITDLNTGLMWQKNPGEKMTHNEAASHAETLSIGGYDDWRLPTIKELYSLILFSGTDPSGPEAREAVPFIDTDYFIFEYGDETSGERIIDSQFVSSTKYVSTTMGGDDTVFGVNFADGRIKGYPIGPMRGQPEGKEFFVLYVRGNTEYGINDFIENGDGTITDNATGLMWSQPDSGERVVWEGALALVQEKNEENYLGYSDWRLPNAKELQSIVDYSRSPDTTGSAAIDPVFEISGIINEAGDKDYPFYWSSTTHVKSNGMGDSAVYISFGRALGYMEVFDGWTDVHGAGAQRSDPKSGNPDDFPSYFGPQGDVRRLYNFVRYVRDNSLTDNSIEANNQNAGTQALEGVTLFAPIDEETAYLIGMQGNIEHEWELSSNPGHSVYLLEDGNLLATYSVKSDVFNTRSLGGGIEILDWDSNKVWSYEIADSNFHLHHDIEALPNGNTLAIAWEIIQQSEALNAGFDSTFVSPYGEIWSEAIFEIDPDTDSIVWEWHVWDHLLPEGYIASSHPERIDPDYPTRRNSADWLHINSVDYNEALDQILLSVHNTNEIWIIDHDISTSEAAGSKGDLLYRWGNPEAYGSPGPQELYFQHDVEWIDPESTSSNIILFNNGHPKLRPYSNVLELGIPGPYAYGGAEIVMEYGSSEADESFFSNRISGVQRLENGNTLICSGAEGWIFEITSNGEKVWEHRTGKDVFRAERYSSDYINF